MAGFLAGCTTTPTSTPSPTQSVDREATNVTCAENTAFCFPGDIGPGGGIIFSVVPGNGQATILEVAPKGWFGQEKDPRANNWSHAMIITQDYRGGKMTDWHLPTKDELDVLQKYPQRNIIGGFVMNYWSSTSYNDSNAWYQDFWSDTQAIGSKSHGAISARPVRTAQSPLS